MSEQNVELHRRVIDAFNARDVEALIALCDPSIEFHSAMTVPGVIHGHDGMRKWLEDLEDAWGEEIRIEPEAYFDLGEHTVVFQKMHGRGRQSGVEIGMPAAAVAMWRDGLCMHFKGYAVKEEALRNLGVSEDALEPIAP